MKPSIGRSTPDSATNFYVEALAQLESTGIPFLLGGAFAFSYYSGVPRDTKDVDIFVKPEDFARVLAHFDHLGYETRVPYPHWLGKIHSDGHFVDVIFSSGNGLARVDEGWFEGAPRTSLLGLIVRVSPVEEMIWSKAFVQERERFDGADVMHLLRERGPSLDWRRLLTRFGAHWRVLLSHLILFGFVYPDRRQNVPAWVMDDLLGRLAASHPSPESDVCFGTLLSREQYLHDIRSFQYRDSREQPEGPMSPREIEIWTRAISNK